MKPKRRRTSSRDANGRVTHAEALRAGTDEVKTSYTVVYDTDGEVARVEQVHNGVPSVCTYAREASHVTATSAGAHFEFTLDRRGRIASLERGNIPGDVDERQTWTWRRDRLVEIAATSAGGVEGVSELGYECL